MNRLTRVILGLLLTGTALTPAALPAAEITAITNARIMTAGPAGTLERATIVIGADGRIAAIGTDPAIPKGARIVDAAGKVVTPGLFATGSNLSAVEVDAVEGTNDESAANPHLSAALDMQYGLNPDAADVAAARLGGITRAVVTPAMAEPEEAAGLIFSGQAALIHLGEGPSLLDAPRIAMVTDLGEAAAARAGGTRATSFVALKAMLDEARRFARNPSGYDDGTYRHSRADLEALLPVVRRRMPLMIGVHRAADIRQVLRLAREEDVRIILEGAAEGWRVASEIAAAQVPVIVNPLSNLPARFEMRGATLENAARLHAAGVLVAIQGERTGHQARQLRYYAGNAAAHGLPHDAALAAITANPARIFGVDDRLGTLERGKEADVVIWDGDPLEPLTQPVQIFVRGENVPLDSRARRLAERYRPAASPLPPAYH